MSNSEKNTGATMRLLKRALSVGWKLALLAGVAGFVTYRMRFAPVSVDSHAVVTGPITAEAMGTGTLESRVAVTISPKISGLITQVLADQGDRITKGQVLATLDDGDLRQQVEMAKADLAATKAGVDRAAGNGQAKCSHGGGRFARTGDIKIAIAVAIATCSYLRVKLPRLPGVSSPSLAWRPWWIL